jgi:transcriptional antiterminator Rof (Rho-off)
MERNQKSTEVIFYRFQSERQSLSGILEIKDRQLNFAQAKDLIISAIQEKLNVALAEEEIKATLDRIGKDNSYENGTLIKDGDMIDLVECKLL